MRLARTLLVAGVLGALGLAVAATPDPNEVAATHAAVEAYVQQSVGTFERYQDWLIGDPAQPVYDMANRMQKAGIPYYVLSLAVIIAVSGYVAALWRGVKNENRQEIKDANWQIALVAAVLAFSFNYGNPTKMSISNLLMGSWYDSYTFSKSRFSSDLDDKLHQSSKIMVGLLGEVAVTATTVAAPELRAIGATSAKGLAALAKTSQGRTALAKVGGNALGRIGSKMSFSVWFMQALIFVYAEITSFTGQAMLIIAYLFPIAMAMTMWGQTKLVWIGVGTGLSAFFIVMFLPILTYGAMDRVFVQPARAATEFKQEMGVYSQISYVQSALAGEKFDASIDQAAKACENAQENNPMANCLSGANAGLFKSAWKFFNSQTMAVFEGFKQTIGRVLDMIFGMFIQVMLSGVYYVIAVVIMLGLVVLITNFLGGAATTVGNSLKGRK